MAKKGDPLSGIPAEALRELQQLAQQLRAQESGPKPPSLGADHVTVPVVHGRRRADIDRKIAPLVLEIWRAGINTAESCEEDLYSASQAVALEQSKCACRVMLRFPRAQDALSFLRIMLTRPSRRLARRILGMGCFDLSGGTAEARVVSQLHRDLPNLWSYFALPSDPADLRSSKSRSRVSEPGNVDFDLTIKILFPRSDLPLVVDRLRSYNRARSRKRS